MDAQRHWDQVYRTRQPTEVSWYAPHLKESLRIIEEAAPERGSPIIDVGGGEATLVDDLLARGYRDLSVLDVSATALAVARARLGELAGTVDWLIGDVTALPLARHRYDVWHDRAVFHFLIDPKDRAAYVRQVVHAVKPGGTSSSRRSGRKARPGAAVSTCCATTRTRSTTSSAPASGCCAT